MYKNLFEMMPTNQSENITSAVLAFIFNGKDDELKRIILKEFVDLNPNSLKVAARLEEATSSDEGRGRIDLVIELDGKRVYGVENKISADFEKKQLERYKSYFDDKYKKSTLISLIPEGHQGCDYARVVSDKVVYWESLIKIDVNELPDSFEKYVWLSLIEFVKNRLDPFESLDLEKLMTIGQDEKRLTDDQSEFLRVFCESYLSQDASRKSSGGFTQATQYYDGRWIGEAEDKESKEYRAKGYICLERSKKLEDRNLKFVILSRSGVELDKNKFEMVETRDTYREEGWVNYETRVLGHEYLTWRLKDAFVPKDKEKWREFGLELSEHFNRIQHINEISAKK